MNRFFLPARKIEIIVCDDHALCREGLKNAFRNYEDISIIAEAANGLQLLELLDRLSSDIVILNVNMPGLNGMETLPILRGRYPDLKVIMWSMVNDQLLIRRAMELGAHSYITKERGFEEVYEAIRDCYTDGIYFNEEIIAALLSTKTAKSVS